jgi:LPXTG-site transpeptidase (sortase) family protein
LKKSKKSPRKKAGVKAPSNSGTGRRAVLFAACALICSATFITALLFFRAGPPPPLQYDLETSGNEIDFSAPALKTHTAADGIAIVRTAAVRGADLPASVLSPGQPDEAPGFTNPASAGESSGTGVPLPAAPAETARIAADLAAIALEQAAAPTHGGFTLPVPMDGGSIGILTIPDLGLSVRVYESEDEMEAMQKGAAHFKSTSAWEGNIALSAHNVNLDGSPGYFLNLHTLEAGAVIRYQTALGEREYSVVSVAEIAETDWSKLGRTQDNRVTLITCVTGKPALRLCVQAVEKARQ